MPRKIIDEFSDLPVSPQRKTQLRNRRDGKCRTYGQPLSTKTLCLKHAKPMRERARLRIGAKRRNKGALTYRLARKLVGRK
jgi:hypothetical protein